MSGRRANGEGTEPLLRKDGRWQAGYTGADGRRRVVTTPRGSTKSACRDALRAAIRRTEDGSAPPDGRLVMHTFCTSATGLKIRRRPFHARNRGYVSEGGL
jgi:hypothetical protein